MEDKREKLNQISVEYLLNVSKTADKLIALLFFLNKKSNLFSC